MAEWSVTDVVHKSSSNSRSCHTLGECTLTQMSPDNSHQPSRHMEDADAVDKARVRGAREDELGKPELLNPAKPLERPSLNDVSEGILKLVGSELNEVVKRIPNALSNELSQRFLLCSRNCVKPQYRGFRDLPTATCGAP